MFAVPLPLDAGPDEFRSVAKLCLSLGLAPADLVFVRDDEPTWLPPLPTGSADIEMSVPRAYSELLHDAICHSAPDRFALLYDVLWRITHGEPALASRTGDKAVARLLDYRHAVRRDIHKMHAFLRFKESRVEDRNIFVAWFEPQFFVLKRAIPFFVDRFSNMEWLIATPLGSAAWRDRELHFGPASERPPDTSDSVLDDLWLTYYRTTFNPARLRTKTMMNHMPRHYWNNMPETALIPDMVLQTERRVSGMLDMDADQPELFAKRVAARRNNMASPQDNHAEGSLAAMRQEAETCRRCPLYKNATQTVFGEGPGNAPVVFVGEQPGDQEDLAGKPFVGPAGQLFDRALLEAGLDRSKAYVTNAVKHFKFEPRGKRRLHKKPNAGEVQACRWWLEGELTAIKPELVVALGATAAQSLASKTLAVTKLRGPFDFPAHKGFITVHPSFLLRLPDAESKEREYRAFIDDLKRIGELVPAIRP